MNLLLNNCSAVLNDIGRWFCNYCTDIFIQSGILIILLLIIDFLLRKRVRATFRYWIWMLVLLKLMLPPAFSLPTGIGHLVGDYIPAQNSISKQISSAIRFKSAGASAPQDSTLSSEIPQVHLSQVSPEPVAPAFVVISDFQSLTCQAVVFVIWLVGVAVLSLLLIHRILFVRRLIAQSEPVKKQYTDMLDLCRQRIGIKRKIELRISGKLQCPAVCGLFRPVTLIPTGLVEKLSPDKLRAVLIHELAHVKRGDLIVNCVQTFLQIIYFYNPLVWFANAVVRRIREQAVDEMVLVTLDAEARSYSNILIDVAEMTFFKTSLSLRLIGVVESKKALSRRIRHILNRPVPKNAKLGALGFIIVILSAAVLLPMAKAQKRDLDIIEPEQTISPFTATLPDVIKVELIGVCENPSQDKQWWRPDGSLLEVSPYDYIAAKAHKGKPREFVVRTTNLTDEKISCRWAFEPPVSFAGGHHPKDKNGKNMNDLWAVAADIDEGIEKITVRFGISAGNWQTQVACDNKGSTSIGREGYGFNFSRPYVQDNHTYIVVSDDMVKVPYRVIAIDKNYKIHEAVDIDAGTVGNIRQSSFGFENLPVQNIQEFQFQTRLYQWITFRNVSVQPDMKTDVQIEIEIEGGDVLKVPSYMYPTIQSAVEAAKQGDKIVLDSSAMKDNMPEQNKPDVQTEESRELKTILLPDVDNKGLMLDLASGELVKVPKGDTPADISSAIDKLNKGDLVFDASSLILVRGATSGSLPETTELFKTYKIGQRLPEILNLKIKEGEEWTIEILSIDKNGCRLQYYPVHPNNYVSAIPLTTLEHELFKQVIELFKQVEKKYPEQAAYSPAGSQLYHVDAQGRITIWCYQRLGHRSTDCAADEVGWGSSRLVDAMGMYYLPNGTPLQSRWRERGGGMKDIRVKLDRSIAEDERVRLIHRHELSSKNDLYSRDGRERKIMLHSWNSSPLAIIVRIDRPLRLSGWALGDVETDIQHFNDYDKLLITGPPVDNSVPMIVTIQPPQESIGAFAVKK